MVRYRLNYMRKLSLRIGEECCLNNQVVRIHKILDLKSVLVKIVASGIIEKAVIDRLEPLQNLDNDSSNDFLQLKDDVLTIGEKDWQKAQKKFEILKPLLANRGKTEIVDKIVEENNLSRATIYRWLNQYDNFGSVASLVESPKRGGAGKTRVSKEIEKIIQDSIQEIYLNKQRKSVAKVILDVNSKCFNANLKAPGENTIRRFVQKISEEEKVKNRLGRKVAYDQFSVIKGSFPGADYPLAVVQIDHTPVDIILVDERGINIGRPYLTVAMDVYSRMVLGFYLSFDPAGTIGTALCISHSILDKKLWLSNLGLDVEWECWGVMRTLHLDNAREFKSEALKRGCEKYGISIDFRPVATPRYGGHIERLIGTFMKEIHTLPGTTFSNVKEKGKYDSEKEGTITLAELEKWFTIFVTQVYHKRLHSELNMSPSQKYNTGIFGDSSQVGVGLPERLFDEKQVILDFMPFHERSIQQYGIVIDHIYYYDDVLRIYVNSLEQGSGKSMVKKKFIFKYDPRDISCVYFLDPPTKLYHKIPYRDTSHPAISVWEFKNILSDLKKEGKKDIDEAAIFKAYEQMQNIVLAAVDRKKKLSKSSNRTIESSKTITLYENGVKITKKIDSEKSIININDSVNLKEIKPILPFDGLDDD